MNEYSLEVFMIECQINNVLVHDIYTNILLVCFTERSTLKTGENGTGMLHAVVDGLFKFNNVKL